MRRRQVNASKTILFEHINTHRSVWTGTFIFKIRLPLSTGTPKQSLVTSTEKSRVKAANRELSQRGISCG